MPQKPLIITVKTFIPIEKLNCFPIRLVIINNIIPQIQFIISFDSIFNGHLNSFTTIYIKVISITKYNIYIAVPSMINNHLIPSLFFIILKFIT